MVKTFWALDAALASSRHFPAINWLTSYSLYLDDLEPWYAKNIGEEWVRNRREAMQLLQRESELKDIVQLVGIEALPEDEKVVLEIGRMLRDDYLRQSAYDENDAYTSMNKQKLMLASIMRFAQLANDAVKKDAKAEEITKMKVRDDISRMKEVKEKDFEKEAEKIAEETRKEFNAMFAELAKGFVKGESK